MESMSSVKIAVFSGAHSAEWFEWKPRFEALLICNDLIDVLEQARPAADASEQQRTWDRNNRSVYARLVLFTKDAAHGVVSSVQGHDGLAAWKLLVDKFEHKSTVKSISIHTELMNLTMGELDDPDEFFHKAEHLRRQLVNQGTQMPDSAMQALIMTKLPQSYHTLVTVLNTRDFTYDEVKSQAQSFFRFNIERAKPQRDGGEALAVHQVGPCFTCGAMGHLANACPRIAPGGTIGTGRNGGGGGRGGSGVPHSGRGGGRRSLASVAGQQQGSGKTTVRCFHCGKRGHYKRDCRARAAGQPAAHMVSHSDIAFPAVEGGGAVRKADPGTWVVDSGCTAHMTTSSDGMVNIREEPGQVIVGGGSALMSTGCGDYLATIPNQQGRNVAVTLKNVLVVPQLGRNLLSVQRLAQGGGSACFGKEGTSNYLLVAGQRFPIQQAGRLYEVELTQANATVHTAAVIDTHQLRVPVTAPSTPAGGNYDNRAFVTTDGDLWHRRLGHRNDADLRQLAKLNVGIPAGVRGAGTCDVCQVCKHSHHSFPDTADNRTTARLELVHCDLIGVGI